MADNHPRRNWIGAWITLAALIVSFAYCASNRYRAIGQPTDRSLLYIDQWTGQVYVYGPDSHLQEIHRIADDANSAGMN